MLDVEVKQRIKTLRNILVGKLPNPIEQVNQISNALLYKFMDDQDRVAEKFGGKPSFFVGELEKYAWHKIFDSKLSNQEKADLYIEGINRLSKAKDLPPLFRQIFKDAVFPFRGADTIAMFLQEINKFDYNDNPEQIATAFEHVLDIMGSQGDAGQFRTPHHIIKFIVDVVDPQKDESILDPACGTAGFLVEAYRHITEKEKLTPQEFKILSENIHGIDIAPEMAKFARINLYLHGFKTPDIKADDTLTNENFWGKKHNVILANPPFMTPKGGIKPHDKFAVKANRSEVLFVDYIMEHLKINGRAGVIVPEGIIFKSDNAYKKLRKMLIEDGLWAVVSLPAGVFQPYSGVKTSILFLDNKRTKETDELLFVKVENDGFDLGAQRRKIDKNDLPEALEILEAWKKGKKKESSLALWVKKEKIAESGDYNLTGERYREVEVRKNQKWPMVELQEVAKVDWGNTELTKKSYVENGEFLGVSAAGTDGRMSHFEHEVGVTVLSAIGANCGKVFYPTEKFTAIKNTITFTPDCKKLEPKYLFYIMKNNALPRRGGGQPFISKGDVEKYKIPLPPLEVQKEIVAEIDGYQKVIDGAKQVIENYKPTIKINPDWEMVELGEVLKYEQPTKYIVKSVDYDDGFETPVLTAGKTFILGYTNEKDGIFPTDKLPVIIFDDFTTAIKFVGFPFKVKSSAMKILHTDTSKAHPLFLYYLMKNIKFRHDDHKRYWISEYSKIKIPLPPLEVQKQIVAEIEAEQKIVNANKKLIQIMEQKIQQIIEEI